MIDRGKGKVLFVASVYSHLAAFHKPFMQLLMDEGYEVHSAASSASGRMAEVAALGVTCWDIPFCRSPYDLQNVKAYQHLSRLIRDNHYELIHVHTPNAAFLTRLAARGLSDTSVLYTAHGFHFYSGVPLKNWLTYYNAERVAARWTSGLIVINQEDYMNARRMGFKAGENLFFVNGVGVPLEVYEPIHTEGASIRSELGIHERDCLITSVAELNRNKNHAFLLDAWARLSQDHFGVHLLLVGKGSQDDILRQRVAQEGLERVYFLGYREDVPSILRESDIVTLVSKREGLPRCIMEAMAVGRPVVGTNVRGIRDLVVDRETGLLVNPGDVQGLCRAFEELLSNEKKRLSMGQAARRRIEAYSLERVIADMRSIYARYLGFD